MSIEEPRTTGPSTTDVSDAENMREPRCVVQSAIRAVPTRQGAKIGGGG